MQKLSTSCLSVLFGCLLFISLPVMANLELAIQAYRAFSLEYSKLPAGECTSTSLQPYINSLNKLATFEAYSANIIGKPDLSAQKHFLEGVIKNNSACRTAGIIFRCAPGAVCKSPKYFIESEILPLAFLGGNKDLSVNGWNINRVNVLNSANMSFRKAYNKMWKEYDANGRLIYQFEEYQRDDWSVYLYDKSRDTAVQIDVHRMMVRNRWGNGPWQDLYTINEVMR
jgi:hypothetical protein